MMMISSGTGRKRMIVAQLGLFGFSNDQGITQNRVEYVARTGDHSHNKGPPYSETANIETGVEMMGAPFDGFEDAGVPLR